MAMVVFHSKEEEKDEKHALLIKETVPFYMDKFEKIVTENDGYFVNGKVMQIFSIIFFTLFIKTMYAVYSMRKKIILKSLKKAKLKKNHVHSS